MRKPNVCAMDGLYSHDLECQMRRRPLFVGMDARKYLPVGTFPTPDQAYSQYKGEDTQYLKVLPFSDSPQQRLDLVPVLSEIPQRGMRFVLVRKKRGNGDYLWLTRELFRLEQHEGQWRLFIGTQRNNIGYLTVNWHRKPKGHQLPNSIWLKRINGVWSGSFCYENGLDTPINSTKHISIG